MLPDPRLRTRTVATLPDELRVRGAQALHSFRERIGLAIGDGAAGAGIPRAVRRELRDDPAAIASAARARLRRGLLPGLRDLAGTVALLRRTVPDAESSTRYRADRAVDGVLDLLGHHAVACGSPIDWHRDPSSGRRAPLRHWSRIAYLDPSVVDDYKLLWEVNRQQHFVTLGQAYAYSRDARYADAFVAQLTSWIAANPPRIGINWASSLEVAYRAISWLWGLQLFADAPQLTDDVLLAALESLRRHALHVERYLSTYYSPNTHLTGEALGLLYVGTALPQFQDADRWRSTGWRILRDQLVRQVREDGSYFEQALYYHRYTADIYHHALLLSDANGWPRDDQMRAHVARLDAFLVHALHPDGTVPLVGDDDGGRLVRLDGRPTNDARPTLATGAALFGRADLRRAGGNAVEECLWLLGATGAAALAAVGAERPAACSIGFPQGGFYVLRDGWSGDETWALVDGGPHGALNCGHAHADALSLEVASGGRTVLADSGTFSYTGEARDRFRATASHNSVSVDGESSSVTAGLFHWRHVARTTTRDWLTLPGADLWRGAHDGFRRLPDPATHERTVLLLHGRYLLVLDVLAAEGSHRWTVHWHAAAGLEARPCASGGLALTEPHRAERALLHLVALGDGGLRTGTSWRSEAYGARTEAPAASYETEGTGRQSVVTALVPAAGRARVSSAPDRAEIAGTRFADVVVRRGRAERVTVGDVTTDAECVVVCGDEHGAPARLILLGASRATLPELGTVAIADGAPWAARRQHGLWQVEPFRAGHVQEG
jgi:hypothetical protein